MESQNLTSYHQNPHDKYTKLKGWGEGIRQTIEYIRGKGLGRFKPSQIREIIKLFFELSFMAQLHGYNQTWPGDVRRMEFHILKYNGYSKSPAALRPNKIIRADEYPNLEFCIEPAGSRFINYGYHFVPDLKVQEAIVDFINRNPDKAKKIIP